MTKMESKGTVTKSESRTGEFGKRITLIELLNEKTLKKENLNLKGQHRIDRGETLLIAYKTDAGTNWVSRYLILDENGDEKYFSICDD